jgi:ABC-type sugar transport system ATPase subunit
MAIAQSPVSRSTGEPVLLEMRNITKEFPGVRALDSVNFDLHFGEVHSLLGENGAGKSTLIKVLGGIYQRDGGEIFIQGRPVEINSVNHARDLGISIIHQELVLVSSLNVAENIFLGREPKKKNRFVDFGLMKNRTEKLLDELHLNIRADAVVSDLSLAQRQMVEIVKAISFNAKIIVMDEPTSSISTKDAETLFEAIARLKTKGIGIIYISHRMSELQKIADRVTVMRDGKHIATKAVDSVSNDELISLMVGRSVANYYTRTYNTFSETILKVEKLNSALVKDISFELKKGEILGFSGLVGAGRTEAILALMGLHKAQGGRIALKGENIPPGSDVWKRIKKGIVLVPEDRKGEGLFPVQSLRFNLTLKILKQFIHGVFYNRRTEKKIAETTIKKMAIRASGEEMPMGLLSGGNQQKAILASWLATDPCVLILDEPTRGIDVGAKSEIYEMMNSLAASGVGIIMISSELSELINMSDRVAVMREGRIQVVLDRGEISQEKIMQYAVTV